MTGPPECLYDLPRLWPGLFFYFDTYSCPSKEGLFFLCLFFQNIVPKVLTLGTIYDIIKTNKKTGGNKDDGTERNDNSGTRRTH